MVTEGCVAKAVPEAALVLGSALNEELAATPPTVYWITTEPEAPVLPAVPACPFPVVLVAHCVLRAPQLDPVVAIFE
jgi:hypothetical protein